LKGIWGNRGAAVVEFALLFLLLMIIVFGIIEFGFIWLQSDYIANAAREGARVAATGQDQSEIENAVKSYLKGMYSDNRVEGAPPYNNPAQAGGCCGSGDFIAVNITDEEIPAGLPAGENPPAVKVRVTVQSAEVWRPVLWDLLRLINPDIQDITEISSFAVFAVEP
jgi:hypothetical protein